MPDLTMSGPALAAVLLGAFSVGILAGILANSALRRRRKVRELRRVFRIEKTGIDPRLYQIWRLWNWRTPE